MSKLYTADRFVTIGGTTAQYVTGTGSLVTFPAIPSGADYIQNQNASAQSANMWISGNAYINGNVGIGTSSPAYKLQVAGEIYNNYRVQINDGTANLLIGHWDGTNTRIENSGGRDLFITSYSSAIKFGIDGSENMRIATSGNIGVGTSSPSYKLDIEGALRASSGILNSNSCFERVLGTPYFTHGVSDLAVNINLGDLSFWGYIEVEVTGAYSNQNTPGKLTKLFAVGTNPGNLIYANESRVSDAFGPVADNMAIGEFYWDGSQYAIRLSHIVSSGNNYTVKVKMFTYGGAAKNVFDAISIGSLYSYTALAKQYPYYNTNVGIGTTSPSVKLHVIGSSESLRLGTTTSDNYFTFFNSAGTQIGDIGYDGRDTNALSIWNSSNGPVLFGANGSERMRITSTGNVGIGTTSPATKLHVDGVLRVDGGTDPNASNAAYLWNQGGLGPTISGLKFAVNTGATGSQSQRFIVNDNGNVGIGTSSPTEKLHIVGSNALQIIQSTTGGQNSTLKFITTARTWGIGANMGLSNSNLEIYDYTASANRLTIDSSGNVGIGTTSPGAKLEVSGDALISGLTIGQGPVTGQGNTALGDGALGSMVGGKSNIAVGSNANSDNDVTGLTVIGVDLNVNPAGSALTQNSLVIGQYNNLNYSTQYPHIYAPNKVNCPNGNTTTDIIAVDYSIYTAIFMEYSIFNSAGDQFRAGTYTAAFKVTGTVVEDDNQTVVYSGTTLAATFTTSVTGSVVTIKLINQDSDTYDIRVTARLLMR